MSDTENCAKEKNSCFSKCMRILKRKEQFCKHTVSIFNEISPNVCVCMRCGEQSLVSLWMNVQNTFTKCPHNNSCTHTHTYRNTHFYLLLFFLINIWVIDSNWLHAFNFTISKCVFFFSIFGWFCFPSLPLCLSSC